MRFSKVFIVVVYKDPSVTVKRSWLIEKFPIKYRMKWFWIYFPNTISIGPTVCTPPSQICRFIAFYLMLRSNASDKVKISPFMSWPHHVAKRVCVFSFACLTLIRCSISINIKDERTSAFLHEIKVYGPSYSSGNRSVVCMQLELQIPLCYSFHLFNLLHMKGFW